MKFLDEEADKLDRQGRVSDGPSSMSDNIWTVIIGKETFQLTCKKLPMKATLLADFIMKGTEIIKNRGQPAEQTDHFSITELAIQAADKRSKPPWDF